MGTSGQKLEGAEDQRLPSVWPGRKGVWGLRNRSVPSAVPGASSTNKGFPSSFPFPFSSRASDVSHRRCVSEMWRLCSQTHPLTMVSSCRLRVGLHVTPSGAVAVSASQAGGRRAGCRSPADAPIGSLLPVPTGWAAQSGPGGPAFSPPSPSFHSPCAALRSTGWRLSSWKVFFFF